jgi:hypothetical protein
MSTALIRGNMLTQLANRGESAAGEIDRLIREFLADTPGPWMPEDFLAPYELLERSIDEASSDGRHFLLRMLHQLVSELFVDMEARKLNEAESRQMLGAMAVIGRHDLLRGSKYPNVLEFASRWPQLFWSRVFASPEIVSDREKFIRLLIEKLPSDLQKRIQLRPEPDESPFEHIAYIFGYRPAKKVLRRAILNHMVEVEMILNGVLHKAGVVRINDRCKVVINENEFSGFPARAELPAVNLGEVVLEVPSPRNIANVTITRFNESLETTLFPRRQELAD